jgi:pimeloyl-ACP methyl ester carboxylesterase
MVSATKNRWIRIRVVLFFLAFAGGVYQEMSESSDLAELPAPGRLIAVGGNLMHIDCRGEGSPTVVLELGVGSAAVSWLDIHRQLARITCTCAYDRSGLGCSEAADVSRDAEDVAQRLHSLLEGAGIEDQLLLVGWSAGGVYVREYYRQLPGQVAAMLLVDSSHEQQANRLPPAEAETNESAMLRIASLLAPFGLVRLSGIMDRRVDESKASEEAKARLRVLYLLSHTLHTVIEESDAFDDDIDSNTPPGPLGDLPLIVLSRGTPEQPTGPESSAEASESMKARWEVRNELQRELAALSTNGRQIIATESGHHIYADQPQLVLDSVRELVGIVRSSAAGEANNE